MSPFRFVASGLILLSSLGFAQASAVGGATIDHDFAAPPNQAKPFVWWHWMGNNVDEEGIDKDLAAMKDAGIGGALLCSLASLPSIGNAQIENTPWPDTVYFNPKWWALVKHAVTVAGKQGFEMSFSNCPGWAVSGGPWITPELSMQKVVWSETPVKGPSKYAGSLAQPRVSAKWNYYRDVAALAVPEGDDAKTTDVVDLTSHMKPDGSIAWDVPAGSWIIYRFGHTTTGVTTHPCPDNFPPCLECDKLSEKAAAVHVNSLLAVIHKNLGDLAPSVLRDIHFDSYEAGDQNWTNDYREEFQKLRGYDLLPWLPVLAGRTLNGPDQTARFKWDMKQTISDLFVKKNYATFSRILKQHGFAMSSEPYTGPFDTISATAEVSHPQGEFWSNPDSWLTGRASHDVVVQTVAAAAQAVGIKMVQAEAFTGFPMDSKWTEDPAFLKPACDDALCRGVNAFQLHSWVLQPFADNIKPGLTLSWWGTHFGRNQTWFEPGKVFFQYLARCAALLQRGQVVSDFCSLEFPLKGGDAISYEILLNSKVEDGRLLLPSGRHYAALVLRSDDRTMQPIIARKLEELVAAGAAVIGPKPLTSPGLEGYPGCDQEVAAIGNEVWGSVDGTSVTQGQYKKGRIFWGVAVPDALAALGVSPDFAVKSVGDADIREIHRHDGNNDIYFLANIKATSADPIATFRVAGKVPELWSAVDGKKVAAARWTTDGKTTEVPLHFGPDESIFVVFRNPSHKADPIANVTVPEGAPAATTANGRLFTDASGHQHLVTPTAGSYTVTYASGRTATVVVPSLPASTEVAGPWEVDFASNLGAPDKITMDKLASWTSSADAGVKYFSGSATYKKQIEVTADQLKSKVLLDLGTVHNLAQVRVNGRDLGVAWSAPFAFDLTPALRPGANDLEIIVTNTWHNRLIGDEQLPPDIEWGPVRMFRKTIPVGAPLKRFPDWLVQHQPRPTAGRVTLVDWNYFTKDSPLIDAGLIGPVTLNYEAEAEIPAH